MDVAARLVDDPAFRGEVEAPRDDHDLAGVLRELDELARSGPSWWFGFSGRVEEFIATHT